MDSDDIWAAVRQTHKRRKLEATGFDDGTIEGRGAAVQQDVFSRYGITEEQDRQALRDRARAKLSQAAANLQARGEALTDNLDDAGDAAELALLEAIQDQRQQREQPEPTLDDVPVDELEEEIDRRAAAGIVVE